MSIFSSVELFAEGYIYHTTTHHTIRQTQFFEGVGSVLRFQIPKFAHSCTLYPFDTLDLLHIVFLLYHFDTLYFLSRLTVGKVTPPADKLDKTLQGAGLFAPNYPPHIYRPNKPRHNRTNIRAIFLAYYRTKQNPVFIYFYCTLFRIHWTGGNFVDTFRHFVDYYLRGVCPLYYIWDIIKHNKNITQWKIQIITKSKRLHLLLF